MIWVPTAKRLVIEATIDKGSVMVLMGFRGVSKCCIDVIQKDLGANGSLSCGQHQFVYLYHSIAYATQQPKLKSLIIPKVGFS